MTDPGKGIAKVFGKKTTSGFLQDLDTNARKKAEAGVKSSTKGPADKWRGKKPDGYDDAEWNKHLDEINQRYNKEKATGQGKLGFKTTEMQKIENAKLENIVRDGVNSGTIKTTPKTKGQKAAQTFAGESRDVVNENKARQLAADAARQGANETDQRELRDLKGAQKTASEGNRKVAGEIRTNADTANKNTRDTLANMGKDFDQLNTQDQNALADYLSSTDPMMKEIFARTSDPADIQRQLDSYKEQQGVVDKYKELTDPQVTGQERYLSELARREFESGDKSNREAVSEQLANRGLRSGGQQIAGQQQSTQQLSQDRLLKELGIQASAVDRSMKAMEGWNTASANLGLASGAIRTANDSQRQYEDKFRATEAERRSKLAGERNKATTDTTYQVGERKDRYATVGMDHEKDIYDRNTDVTNADQGVIDKDYAMGGDYYNAATGAAGRTVERADSGVEQGRTTGTTNADMLADSLGLTADADADADEQELAYGYIKH